jgi:hypothetical protein
MIDSLIPRTIAVIGILAIGASEAAAQVAQTPSISGNSWIAIAILLGFVLLIGLMISGSLSVSKIDDTPPDADQGVGVFEGIEEDDERER